MSFAEQLTRLQAFLDADELHDEALDYVAAHGYLTALSICSEEVPEREWIDAIFSEAPHYKDDAQRAEIEARNQKAKDAAGKAGEALDGSSYILIRQAGETGQLYGSVTGRDVADMVNAEGGKIDRSMVVLDKPIKTLGVHPVKVRLHAEVTVSVNINIARSQDEAERQARGENVIASQFEEDRAADEQAAQDMLEGGAGQQDGEYGDH